MDGWLQAHQGAAKYRRHHCGHEAWSAGMPALLRIAGFTTTMYDMVVNVVRPAMTSREKVVPC